MQPLPPFITLGNDTLNMGHIVEIFFFEDDDEEREGPIVALVTMDEPVGLVGKSKDDVPHQNTYQGAEAEALQAFVHTYSLDLVTWHADQPENN